MKYLLALIASPALAISVGDCINRSVAQPGDYGYLFKVDEVRADSYLATHAIFERQKLLPKRLNFVEVTCPNEEEKQAYLEKIKDVKAKKPE